MAIKGRNEKLHRVLPELQGSDHIGLSLKFKNSATGKTRELLFIPPVNITMLHAAAMTMATAFSI